MARKEKKTRLRGLPPRVFKTIQSSETGSYPIVARGAVVDNRTGFLTSHFNDINTMIFTSSQDINYASKLVEGSPSLTSELSTSFSTNGNIVKGVSDGNFLKIIDDQPKQDLQPFNDNINPAAEQKGNASNEFYATGSSPGIVGEGFDSPLWSKHKIEIDISSNPCSFEFALSSSFKTPNVIFWTPDTFTSGTSYPMAYYNFDSKVWEGIGVGYAPNDGQYMEWSDTTTSQKYTTAGFTPGIVNSILHPGLSGSSFDIYEKIISQSAPTAMVEYAEAAGRVQSSYAFPNHPRYHATGSQTFKLNNIINRPFLVEKVVVEISSASYTVYDVLNSDDGYNLTASMAPAAVNNFFILNQRRDYSIHTLINKNATAKLLIPSSSAELTAFSSPTTVTTSRDIITSGRIVSFASDIPDTIERIVKLTSSLVYVTSSSTFQLPDEIVSGSTLFYKLTTNADENDTFVTQSLQPRVSWERDADLIIETGQSISGSISGLGWDSPLLLELPVRNYGSYSKFIFDQFEQSVDSPLGQSVILSFWGFSKRLKEALFFTSPSANNLGLRNGLGRYVPVFDRDIVNSLHDQGNVPFTIDDLEDDEGNLDLDMYVRAFHPETIAVSVTNTMFSSLNSSSDFEFEKQAPYILYPQDELIIGWQQPIPTEITHLGAQLNNPGGDPFVPFSKMSFDGPAKVTLYGSYISEGREYNDTLNQLLSSQTVHEIIGGGQ